MQLGQEVLIFKWSYGAAYYHSTIIIGNITEYIGSSMYRVSNKFTNSLLFVNRADMIPLSDLAKLLYL